MVASEHNSRWRDPGIAPLLRWAGSKRQLLPVLSQFWNVRFSRYIEPFMGSACLFFALSPPRALLSDLNGDLVSTYSAVRDTPLEVHQSLRRIPLGKESYYALRKSDPTTMSVADAAARFIFLNRFCFNGLYRTNLSGQFNVPFAPAKTGRLPTKDELHQYSARLRHARLLSGDFSKTLETVRAGDFVYLDPPFAVANRRIFRQYGPHTFGRTDLTRLSQYLDRIHCAGAHFVLSYAYCKEARQCFGKWSQRRVRLQRNIAGFSSNRKTAVELLVTNLPSNANE